ncbi:unnamed protein product [Auanema sp. JU1783]|nr:unnamed protein product [Auanema sp. JU1783]
MKTFFGCVFSLFLLMAFVPSSEQQAFLNPYLSNLDQPDYKGAHHVAAFMPYQKKWSRLEPSIRFFKRSGAFENMPQIV